MAADGRDARAGAVAVAAVVLVYTTALRRFGLDLVDEGTLLAQFADVARGAVPYRDFETGYGPLAFYWNAAVLRWLGGDVVGVRTVLAVVHAASAGLLYAIARRAGGAGIAAATVALLWGMLRPVAPGAFATFNVPYPSWWAEAFGYGAVWTVVGGRGGDRRLALAGALWGLAFLAKQNAGVFGLAGTVVTLALAERRGAEAGAPWIGTGLAASMLLGVAALAGQGGMTLWEALVLATPLLLLACAVVRARPGGGFLREAAVLAAGFVAVALPALAWVGAAVGGEVLLREVLHVGSDAAERFRSPYPTPLAIVADAWRDAPGPLAAGRKIIDGLWLVVLPAAAIAGATQVLRGRVAPGRTALVGVGSLLYLQLLPRADEWHALPAAGLLVALGLSLLGDALPGRRRALVAAAMGLAALRSAPTAPVVGAVLAPVPADAPRVPHASIRWDVLTGEHLTRVPEVTAALAGVRSLVGFPALAFFNFVTDAPSPVRHRYFFPGVPGAEEMRRMLARLEVAPPDAVVVSDAPLAFFRASFDAHPDLVRWLRSSVWTTTSLPPYTIGRRAGS